LRYRTQRADRRRQHRRDDGLDVHEVLDYVAGLVTGRVIVVGLGIVRFDIDLDPDSLKPILAS
jgi:hypothetical protein